MKASTLCARIVDYLDKDLILFLNVTDRKGALSSLVTVLEKQGKLLNRDDFYSAILERERVVSTGIGLHVAIPHAKLMGYQDFFIAIGVQREGPGIEWNALDGQPVKLIFMIGGPEDRQTDYLRILSLLTSAIKDVNRRKSLLQARTPAEIIQLFANC